MEQQNINGLEDATIEGNYTGKNYSSSNLETNTKQENITLFLSYNWQDRKIADRIDEHFSSIPGIIVKRDKRDIKEWGSIREFMKSIRKQDYAVLIISDSYLKSANCMFEVTEMMKEQEYKGRIFPAVKERRIYKPQRRVKYTNHWKKKYKKLKKSIKRTPLEDVKASIEDLERYKSIKSSMGEFLNLVSDMNNPEIKEIEKQIEAQIKKDPKYREWAKANAFRQRQIDAGWGDSEGGRRSYSLEEINQGILGDRITFNSITIVDSDKEYYRKTFGREMPSGIVTHEKNFVGACEYTGINAGTANVWNGNNITVVDGREYIVRLYVHNNNPNKNAVAKDVFVSFSIPVESAKRITVWGFIHSSNARPNKYWSGVNFNSDTPFHLKYIKGSAILENNNVGAREGGIKLSDDIVQAKNKGTWITYDSLENSLPGGYASDCYVTIKVKAVFDYNFNVAIKVRLVGSENQSWEKNVNANIGDKVEFQIEYKNTSDKRQTGVTIKDTLPPNLRYIAGSTRIKNSTCSNGVKYKEDYIISPGLDIGSYGSDENAFLSFYAEVVDDCLTDGSNNLINWVQAGVGDTTFQAYARVFVQKPKQETAC